VFRLIRCLAIAAMLTGCAANPPHATLGDVPALRLSPASLGHDLAVQQRLQIVAHGQSQTLDALLEVDAQQLRLGVQALGQSALTLQWDGKTLQQQRADWLPPVLSGDRVLFDLQLVFWPAEAIRSALPSDWSLQESAGQRHLLHAGTEVVRVNFVAADRAVLTQLLDDYSLDITSTAAAGAGQ
jgi:hypothetical protein